MSPTSSHKKGTNVKRSYQVGYGRPPVHSRFHAGISGNPRGRPRFFDPHRAKRVILEEAYRLVGTRDGDKMPMFRAVVRSQLALAAKGNGAAQRSFLKLVQDIEAEILRSQRETKPQGCLDDMTDAELMEALEAIRTLSDQAKHSKGRKPDS